ncbi:protein of unknown function [Burkholderia multivorans]
MAGDVVGVGDGRVRDRARHFMGSAAGVAMSGSAAFADLGYRIEDGDIGYDGKEHLSFRVRALPRIGGAATPTGSALCRELLDALRARFQRSNACAETRAVAPHAYQAAVASVMQGA